MMRYLWCPLCEQTAVHRSGDVCGLCMGELEAIVHPDDREPVPPRRHVPLGVRMLRWLTMAVSVPR